MIDVAESTAISFVIADSKAFSLSIGTWLHLVLLTAFWMDCKLQCLGRGTGEIQMKEDFAQAGEVKNNVFTL